MSKQEKVSTQDAPEITAELQSGVNNIRENSMNPHDLLKLNVNEHTEEKNGLTYLSWAWAWIEALKADPNAVFQVHLFGDKPYMEVNGTAMVWVTVTMFATPRTCMLPVMDHKNNPITIEGVTTVNKYGKEIITKVDSFNVNTAIMRCMTKALSLHGLGIYIYSGEDLPEQDTRKPTEVEKEEVKEMVTKTIQKVASATVGDTSDPSRELFAEGMMKYCDICLNEDALKSYWKANENQLLELKASHNDLYKTVLNHFTTAKKALLKKD